MNIFEISQTALHGSQSAWDTVARFGAVFSGDMVCAVTVNSAVLALTLVGAILLVVPYESRMLRMFRRTRRDD